MDGGTETGLSTINLGRMQCVRRVAAGSKDRQTDRRRRRRRRSYWLKDPRFRFRF
jgi:hypothetical protein